MFDIEDLEEMILLKIIEIKYPKGFKSIKKVSKEIKELVNSVIIDVRLIMLEDAGAIFTQKDKDGETVYGTLPVEDLEYKMELYYKSKDISEINIFIENSIKNEEKHKV